jgi:lipoprotein-anchoring transpeptidase ErfK/SrfK
MRHLVPLACLVVLAGCDASAPPPLPAAPQATPNAPPAPQVRADDVDRLNKAKFDANAAAPTGKADAPDPALIRAEVLLARARFSPGAIDGKSGTNLKHAVAAFQTANNIDGSGQMDADTWKALTATPGGAQPVAKTYVTTDADIAGPFAPDVGEDFVKLAAQPDGPQFATPLEALAERFHMSQSLMQALNPAADFSKAGQTLVVIDAAPPEFAKGDVKTITVSKTMAELTAYDADGKVVATYPATVGSTDRPSPSGVHKVNGVARNPDYTYDPAKLQWGPRSHGKLTIKPGPNNPVGVVWIDLNAPSYGIHGSPDPDKIGKTGSHGCVRLTNWDAQELAAGVKPGVVVTFEGKRGGKAKA